MVELVPATEAAQRFVTPLTFKALGAKCVYTSDWEQSESAIPHIDATKSANLLLVAPATANILAKAAQGIADDILSAAILAARCPVAYAPAMNTFMWHNQATQRNVAQLTQDGAVFLGPASGEQACGDIGSGRMLEPEEIIELLQGALFSPGTFPRKNFAHFLYQFTSTLLVNGHLPAVRSLIRTKS